MELAEFKELLSVMATKDRGDFPPIVPVVEYVVTDMVEGVPVRKACVLYHARLSRVDAGDWFEVTRDGSAEPVPVDVVFARELVEDYASPATVDKIKEAHGL